MGGAAMFIVCTGMVRMEHSSRAPRVLSGGDSFGEEILAGLEEKYAYTVTAIKKQASLFMIEEEYFQKLFEHMPNVKEEVLRNATAIWGYANRGSVLGVR